MSSSQENIRAITDKVAALKPGANQGPENGAEKLSAGPGAAQAVYPSSDPSPAVARALRASEITGCPVAAALVNDKKPAGPFKDSATADQETITSLFAVEPHAANVLATLPGRTVVDIDRRNGGTIPEWVEGVATLVVETPNGWHYYFDGDCKPGPLDKENHPGIDIKSGPGSYVLAPGSVVNGVEYTVLKNGTIAQLPELVRELRGARCQVAITAEDLGVDADVAESRFRAWAKTADEPEAGARNHWLATAAAMKAGDAGLKPDDAVVVIRELFAHLWDAGELEGEVPTTIRSAYQSRTRAIGDWDVATADDFEQLEAPTPAPSTDTDVSVLDEPDADTSDDAARYLYLDDANIDQANETHEYLIKGWILKGQNVQLFGKWSTGKTFCLIYLAACVAAGLPWCGHRTRQNGVLMLEYEGRQSLRSRLKALRIEHPEFKDAPVMVYPIGHPLLSKNDHHSRGRAAMERAIAAFTARYGALPEVMIIDPLRDALGGSDSDADLTTAYIELSRELLLRGMTVITAHHPGHGATGRGRGDSGVDSAMDVIIQAHCDKGGQRWLVNLKNREQRLADNIPYDLPTVVTGRDDEGDIIESCVWSPSDPMTGDGLLKGTQLQVWQYALAQAAETGEHNVLRSAVLTRAKAGGMEVGAFNSGWRQLKEREGGWLTELANRVGWWTLDRSVLSKVGGPSREEFDDLL